MPRTKTDPAYVMFFVTDTNKPVCIKLGERDMNKDGGIALKRHERHWKLFRELHKLDDSCCNRCTRGWSVQSHQEQGRLRHATNNDFQKGNNYEITLSCYPVTSQNVLAGKRPCGTRKQGAKRAASKQSFWRYEQWLKGRSERTCIRKETNTITRLIGWAVVC